MRSALVIVPLVFTVACAGQEATDQTVGGGPPATSQPPADSHVPNTVTFTDTSYDVEMVLDDFYFDPTTIKAPGDSVATIELTNSGDTSHTFTIDALSVDVQLDAGASESVTVEVGTETRYEYYCRFHAESNDMRGSFSPH
jgi:plastocyanin